MDSFELAGKLFGTNRSEDDVNMREYDNTILGVALGESDNGSVLVHLSDDVTPAEGEEGVDVEIPTTVRVEEGDVVAITNSGNGTIGSPRVSGVIGGGDRMAAAVQDAHDLAASVEGIAQQALDVANATGQHFWADDDGAHVTEVTQEEWTDPTDPGYQSGPNSLWNSLGMLFRDGLNHLMALVAGKVVTDSFTVESGVTQYYYTQEPMTLIEVAFDGVATTDYFDYPQRGYILFYSSVIDQHIGETLTVKYRVSSSVSLFDGEGNADSNVVATFSNTKLELAKNNPDASIEMCGGNASIVYESSESWKPKTLTVTGENGVTLRPNDTGANATVEVLDGYGSLKGVTLRSGGSSFHVWDESDLSLYDARIDLATRRLHIKGITDLFDSTGNILDDNDARVRIGVTTQNYLDLTLDGVHLGGMNAAGSGSYTLAQLISLIPETLFEGTYSETVSSAVTLSETAANFSRLRIEWEAGDGYRGSTELSNPNGARFMCSGMVAGSGTNPTTYITWKIYEVVGTRISNWQRSGGYQRGQINVYNSGYPTTNRNELIGITKVLGWR